MSPTPAVPELRPLAMGEMIDRAASFWRAHLKPLFVLNFGFSLVNYIAVKAVTLGIQRLAPAMYTSEAERAQQDPSAMMSQVGITLTLWSVMAVVILWVYFMASMATSRYVLASQLGEPTSPADGLRRGFFRAGALTGAYLLSLCWSTLVTVLLLIPGAIFVGLAFLAASNGSNAMGVVAGVVGALLAGLGLLAAMLWYFLRFLLLPPVLAMEDLGAWGAFRRSGALLSGRVEPGFMGRVVVRAMILFTVVSLILLSVGLVSGLPSYLVIASHGSMFDPSTVARTPQYLLVPAELLQVVVQSAFTPLNFAFCALFYLDMRVRREALDLERKLELSSTLAA